MRNKENYDKSFVRKFEQKDIEEYLEPKNEKEKESIMSKMKENPYFTSVFLYANYAGIKKENVRVFFHKYFKEYQLKQLTLSKGCDWGSLNPAIKQHKSSKAPSVSFFWLGALDEKKCTIWGEVGYIYNKLLEDWAKYKVENNTNDVQIQDKHENKSDDLLPLISPSNKIVPELNTDTILTIDDLFSHVKESVNSSGCNINLSANQSSFYNVENKRKNVLINNDSRKKSKCNESEDNLPIFN